MDWIFENNLPAVLEILAGFAGYTFDESDWDAIAHGIKPTDVEQDRWYDYEFSGAAKIEFRVAREPGSSVVFIETSNPPELEPKIQTVLDLAGERDISTTSPWFRGVS